ncbi:two-component system sensor histidine kinase and response regulator [Thermotomaculum hydrothermale]|uniref:histidine kinase n=1 Tax=Thermotomaculum hydrothermale TaxID=981385 RepID=A0A7R6PTL5_9BACT|nr:hybrid sensor histidine kinase/response regulator [Thermotomaculum hydrothermale]BBB32412.1 two-component system sensor histidine kinase and response regulator [Thermotomaculum hydrothermale]
MKSILIIDDSKPIRDFIYNEISSLVCNKCKIFQAENGLAGIKIAEKEKPDIIFIDVVMPLLNGYATAIRLKNMEGLEKSVLIAMTSETDTDVEKKMLTICQDFVSKPINKLALKKIVKKYLKQEKLDKRNSVDIDSFDAITNEIVMDLQEKVEELTKLNKELEQKSRTINSLYVEADRAKLKLEALIKFREDFLDFIFHEIKGPLSSILGNSEILQMKFFAELGFEGNKLLDNIVNSSLRIKKLMDQVARFNSFDFNIKGKRFIILSKAIDEVLLRYNEFIKEKSLKVSFNCPEPIKIKINREFLVEIIDPIIRNAIIFNKENGMINIFCSREEGYILIEVADTGIGMDDKQLEQAFVPFVQFIDVEHYKTHSLKGLGLGLAMCKKLVEMINGELSIESKKGEGTKVKILIPERV